MTFAWNLHYRTTPFVTIRQAGWSSFLAEAVCWGGVQLALDATSVRILTAFTEPRTAAEVQRDLGVPRKALAEALTTMLDAGVLGVEGLLHERLVPRQIAKVRLGRPLDGGYVIPAGFADMVDGLATFGVGDDLSFENEFADRHGGKVLAFDHTIEAIPYRRPQVTYVKKGVAARRSKQMVTLDEILVRGPFARPMLKMDIEGAEWPVLAACSDRVFARTPIMVFELHGLLCNTPVQQRVFDRLLADHELVHVHANNYGPSLKVDGIVYPEWLEVTFVHRALLPAVETDRARFPTPLDYPNAGDEPELEIGWWR